jgi:hypothetical protein
LDRLPGPQRRALGVAFGLVTGPPADLFMVGLAVLTLLSDTARDRPVLCVIDDAQWLDDGSAEVLGFVTRRLLADRVGMLFAIRQTAEPDPRLQGLPGLRLADLPRQDAYDLLETAISRPIEAGVAERIVVETGGNTLAIVEAAAELTPKQLGGREPLPEPLPVGHQIEDLFVRRVRELPTGTLTLALNTPTYSYAYHDATVDGLTRLTELMNTADSGGTGGAAQGRRRGYQAAKWGVAARLHSHGAIGEIQGGMMEFTRQAFLVQVSTWRLHRLGPSVVRLVLSQFLAGQWRPAAHRTAGTLLLGAVADGLKGLDQPTSPPVSTKDLRPQVQSLCCSSTRRADSGT